MRILMVSCPRREPIQEVWWLCLKRSWPDCPYQIDVLSPKRDIGWNANLIQYLSTLDEEFLLMLLDDHFVEPAQFGDNTANMEEALQFMEQNPDVGLLKVQAGNAAPPEIRFKPWDRVREYDREPHPFKRTNIVPTLYRAAYLQKLSTAVLTMCGAALDVGREGALRMEGMGSKLTEDAVAFPERMFGIDRPDDGYGRSLLTSIANDGVREGRLQVTDEQVGFPLDSIAGIDAFR